MLLNIIADLVVKADLHVSYGIAPLVLMALAQAIPAAINLGKSAHQAHQAKKLGKTERPQYSVPDAIQQAVNSARLQAAQTQLPGQRLAEQKLGQTTSNAIGELKNVSNNPNDLATNIQRLYQGQLGQQNNLNMAAAQNYQDNQGMLRNQLGQLGGYQDKQWDINKFQPYKNNMAASSALREGAFRNASAAGQQVGNAIGGLGNVMYNQQMLDQIMGKGVPTGTGMTDATGSTGMTPTPQNMSTGFSGAVNGVPITPTGNTGGNLDDENFMFWLNKNRTGNSSTPYRKY